MYVCAGCADADAAARRFRLQKLSPLHGRAADDVPACRLDRSRVPPIAPPLTRPYLAREYCRSIKQHAAVSAPVCVTLCHLHPLPGSDGWHGLLVLLAPSIQGPFSDSHARERFRAAPHVLHPLLRSTGHLLAGSFSSCLARRLRQKAPLHGRSISAQEFPGHERSDTGLRLPSMRSPVHTTSKPLDFRYGLPWWCAWTK